MVTLCLQPTKRMLLGMSYIMATLLCTIVKILHACFMWYFLSRARKYKHFLQVIATKILLLEFQFVFFIEKSTISSCLLKASMY